MGQVLHGSATTTEAIRRAIQNSQESMRALSMGAGLPEGSGARCGVMSTRGARERHREILLRFGPENEPAIVVGRQRHELSDFSDGRAIQLRGRYVWEWLADGRI